MTRRPSKARAARADSKTHSSSAAHSSSFQAYSCCISFNLQQVMSLTLSASNPNMGKHHKSNSAAAASKKDDSTLRILAKQLRKPREMIATAAPLDHEPMESDADARESDSETPAAPPQKTFKRSFAEVAAGAPASESEGEEREAATTVVQSTASRSATSTRSSMN